VVIVSGLGALYDPLVAAALRRSGLTADVAPVPEHADLLRGRRVMARGHPNTIYYLTGALLRRLAELGPAPAVFLTVGGRCGPYASDYRRALAAAGFGHVRVIAPALADPRALAAVAELAGLRTGSLATLALGLLRAVVTADVLVRWGCERRAATDDASAVDRQVEQVLAHAARALARGASTRAALASLRSVGAHPVPGRPATPRAVRVRLTGDFFPSITDGDTGQRLLRWLERRGAVVEPPAVTEWLLHQAHLHEQVHGPRLGRFAAGCMNLFRRYALAAGLARHDLDDPAELAALAAPHYPSELRGGSAHHEVGLFLAAARARRADLVISIKPFASITSSSISDAVIHSLCRTTRTRFAAVETTGDAEAQVESRLDLALDLARAEVAIRPTDPSP
jgi:predicted nucleotide-binding protein (sugar kinase/HSP70/actin superfamily)